MTTQTLKQKLFNLEQALQNGQISGLYNVDHSLVPALIKASQSSDEGYAKNARQVLLGLTQASAQEALCQAVIERADNKLTKLVLEAGFLPQTAIKQALFLFLTKQWEKYETLDLDHHLLNVAYTIEREAVKQRIADLIRENGRRDLLKIITGQGSAYWDKLDEADCLLIIELLQKNARWSELWKLAQQVPARYSLLILRALTSSKWQPDSLDEQNGLAKLKQLAHHCENEYPPATKLLDLQHIIDNLASSVEELAISPDSSMLAVGYANGTVQLWEVLTGQSLAVFDKLYEQSDNVVSVTTLAFSPDSQRLACETLNKSPDRWRCNAYSGGLYSPPSNYYPAKQFIWIWNLADGSLAQRIEPPYYTHGNSNLIFSSDSSSIINITYNSINAWEVATGKQLYQRYVYHYGLSVSPFEKVVATTSSKSGEVEIHSIQTGQLLETIFTDQKIISLLVSADGKQLLIETKQNLEIWNITPCQLVTKATNLFYDYLFDFVSHNQYLLTASYTEVDIWKLPEAKRIYNLARTFDKITSLALSKRGDVLVIATTNQTQIYQSKLARLAYLPIDEIKLNDLTWLEETKLSRKITRSEYQWLNFLAGLLSWRWRHEIELDVMLEAGEFDIELED